MPEEDAIADPAQIAENRRGEDTGQHRAGAKSRWRDHQRRDDTVAGVLHAGLGEGRRGQVVRSGGSRRDDPEDTGCQGIEVPRIRGDEEGDTRSQAVMGPDCGQQHADDEPVTGGRQGPVPGEAGREQVHAHPEPECPCAGCEPAEGDQVRPGPAVTGVPSHEPGQGGQGDVEHDLRGQAPQLGQAGEVPFRLQALELQQVGEPHGGCRSS